MKKIGIVVVTYNRLECLKKNIECLLKLKGGPNYSYQIVVIDNCSTDGTGKYMSEIVQTYKHIQCVRLAKNTGGAGGFTEGIRICMQNKLDAIWGMDDDAYPEEDALLNLLSAYEIYGDKTCLWSNCDKDIDFDGNIYKEVKRWMFVGFFIPTYVVGKIALPREDFFIFHDDNEYAYRAINKGYPVIKVKNSVIVHRDSHENLIFKTFLGLRVNLSNFPDWKMYYFVRNYLLSYSYLDKNLYKVLFKILPKLFLKIVLVRPSQLGIFFIALFHGLIRKSGKIYNP